MNPGAAPNEEFDAVLQEVLAMEQEVVLDPENRFEIMRRYGRRAREQGGSRREFLFVRIMNICGARKEMNDNPINVTVTGGQGVVINLGPVQGSINTNVHALMSGGGSQEQVAVAIKELAAAISGSELGDAQKKDALEMVDTIATQAKEPPEKRTGGVIKAMLAAIPTAISAAKGATELWDKFGPVIKGYFGI